MIATPCRDCGRLMIRESQYRARRAFWRAAGKTRQGPHGLCVACYTRARKYGTLPDPAPRVLTTRFGGPTRSLPAGELAQLRRAVGLPEDLRERA